MHKDICYVIKTLEPCKLKLSSVMVIQQLNVEYIGWYICKECS